MEDTWEGYMDLVGFYRVIWLCCGIKGYEGSYTDYGDIPPTMENHMKKVHNKTGTRTISVFYVGHYKDALLHLLSMGLQRAWGCGVLRLPQSHKSR